MGQARGKLLAGHMGSSLAPASLAPASLALHLRHITFALHLAHSR
jgi:hypothetical protein